MSAGKMLRRGGALGLAVACVAGCGDAGGGDDRRGGSAGAWENQPPIRTLEVDGTLGESLGRGNPTEVGPPIVQAVAGAGFVCALNAAGAVWCWGDPAVGAITDVDEDNSWLWPSAPTPIVELPPVDALAAPRAWFGPDGTATILENVACGQTESGAWWCWGNHPENPAQDRRHPLAPRLVTQPGGSLHPSDAPPADVLSGIDAEAGLLLDEVNRCALTREGRLLCWPGLRGESATDLGVVPGLVALAGRCGRFEDGSVGCHLPLASGPRCDLRLTTLQGRGGRVCGELADGTWRCAGRPAGTGRVTLPGLVDVDMTRDCGAGP